MSDPQNVQPYIEIKYLHLINLSLSKLLPLRSASLRSALHATLIKFKRCVYCMLPLSKQLLRPREKDYQVLNVSLYSDESIASEAWSVGCCILCVDNGEKLVDAIVLTSTISVY